MTKLIHLLEELRHDLPTIEDRHDSGVVALQQHTDAAQVLSALDPVFSGAQPIATRIDTMSAALSVAASELLD